MLEMTKSEIKTLDYLFRHLDEDISINRLAHSLGLSPAGTMKVLKKLRSKGVLFSQRKGLADFYRVNVNEERTVNLLKYILELNIPDKKLIPYVSELIPLKRETKMCLVFGSILADTETANDIDVLIVIEKRRYKTVLENIRAIENHLGKKVHAIMQTEDEICRNVGNKNAIVLDALRTGLFLWGTEYIIGGIKQWESMKTS